MIDVNDRHGFGRRIRPALCALVVLALITPSLAQLKTPMGDKDSAPIKTNADELKYNREKGIIEAIGHAVVTKGDRRLAADYIRVNLNTEDAFAAGNVVLTEGEEEWRSRSLSYNFGEKRGKTEGLTGNVEPFQIVAESSEKLADDTFVFLNSRVSTCELDQEDWHWHARAKRVIVSPEEYLKATGMRWHFGSVPVMYVPYWYRNLDADFGYHVYPGYSSRMGAFVLNSYRYRLNPSLRAESHLDYRTRRGVAVGQDFKWNDPADRWSGMFNAYYLDDKKPVDDDEDARTADIESERYRLRLRHRQNYSPRDYLLAQGDYLSDTDILEDFFEDEYRDSAQPDNFASYTHRDDNYTVNVIARARLNDFYENVNRLPEGQLDIMRTRIGDSPFYYESNTAGANLEHVFEDTSLREDFDALRVDTSHKVYHQAKYFGFLNLVPRIGYRGTYYSSTLTERTSQQTTLTTSTNFFVDVNGMTNALVVTSPVTTGEVTEQVDSGADLRSRFELGFETSFKVFKVWENAAASRRHIVEPYANYTLIPEPNVRPVDLYQFDEVDRLDEEHFVKLGLRNKWQSKRNGNPHDLIDADIYTIVRFETDEGQDAVEDFFLDVEFRPEEWLSLDMDAQYSVARSELDRFNSWAKIKASDAMLARIEFRYNRDVSSLLISDVTLRPSDPWSYNLYARHEFEDSRFEEGGCWVQRKFDCLVFRLGGSMMPGYTRTDGSERDDEYRALVEFWLTDFPDMSLAGRHRN